MRATCKSHSDDKVAKGECCQMSERKIYDNFLEENALGKIKRAVFSHNFPWSYKDQVGQPGDGFYFEHNFYEDNKPASNAFDIIDYYFLKKIGAKSLIRVKANLFTKTENLIEYALHKDNEFDHYGAILYLNSCNGYTLFEDGKVESVENRLLIFKSNTLHASTNCTDANVRVNINANFF